MVWGIGLDWIQLVSFKYFTDTCIFGGQGKGVGYTPAERLSAVEVGQCTIRDTILTSTILSLLSIPRTGSPLAWWTDNQQNLLEIWS